MFHRHKSSSFLHLFHLEKAGAHLTAAFCGVLGFMVLATCPAAPEKQMQAGKGFQNLGGQVPLQSLSFSYCLGVVVVVVVVVVVGCLYGDHVLSRSDLLCSLFMLRSKSKAFTLQWK